MHAAARPKPPCGATTMPTPAPISRSKAWRSNRTTARCSTCCARKPCPLPSPPRSSSSCSAIPTLLRRWLSRRSRRSDMEWLRQLGRAIRNIAHIARHNPIWAIPALTLIPIALVRHLFNVAVLILIVGLVLAATMTFVLPSLLGLARDSLPSQIGMILTFLVFFLVPLPPHFPPPS